MILPNKYRHTGIPVCLFPMLKMICIQKACLACMLINKINIPGDWYCQQMLLHASRTCYHHVAIMQRGSHYQPYWHRYLQSANEEYFFLHDNPSIFSLSGTWFFTTAFNLSCKMLQDAFVDRIVKNLLFTDTVFTLFLQVLRTCQVNFLVGTVLKFCFLFKTKMQLLGKRYFAEMDTWFKKGQDMFRVLTCLFSCEMYLKSSALKI